MENGPFIDDFPIETSIYKGFSMAMLNNQMVDRKVEDPEIMGKTFPSKAPSWKYVNQASFWGPNLSRNPKQLLFFCQKIRRCSSNYPLVN